MIKLTILILLVIIIILILIINNLKNKETFRSLEEESFFEKLTEEEKELFKKLSNRDFNSENVIYYKTPYKCLDYADMMIYD